MQSVYANISMYTVQISFKYLIRLEMVLKVHQAEKHIKVII